MTWQPIETVPRDRTPVLVFVPTDRDDDSGVKVASYHKYSQPRATHWQPLPPPPEPERCKVNLYCPGVCRCEYECGLPMPCPTHGSGKPVCSTCNDTHRMMWGEEGTEREVPCTRCPTPCDRCRIHQAAYCAKTPCGCACHGSGKEPSK